MCLHAVWYILDVYSSYKSKEIIFAVLIIPPSQNLKNLCLPINLENQGERKLFY